MKLRIKNPLRGLRGILSSFTKVQKELDEFMEKNAKAITKTEQKLKRQRDDQRQALNVNRKLKEFLS